VDILVFLGFLIFQVKIFTFFKSKSVNLFELELELLLLRNFHHSSVWNNLRALLGRIF